MSGKKRKSEVTDLIVALLDNAKQNCAKEPTVRDIASHVSCSNGFACQVKKWYLDGMVGTVSQYVHHERIVSSAPARPGGQRGRHRPPVPPPKIKVPCLGNAISRNHYVETTYREVGGRKIPDARLCGVCNRGAMELGRFEL